MSKRRRYILAGFALVLMTFSGFAWLYNYGIRAKGQMNHTLAAADAVIEQLTHRDLLVDPSQLGEWQLYWEAVATPIQPHIDPYDDLAITPLLINTAALGLVVIILLLPGGKRA